MESKPENTQKKYEVQITSTAKSTKNFKQADDLGSAESESQSRSSSKRSRHSSRKETNQKRVQRLRMSSDFIKNLPKGITYNEPGSEAQDVIHSGTFANIDDEFKEGDIVRVGDFTINIELVSKQQLISMRKFLPSD